MAAFLLYKIRVSKGGFTFVDWQVAQSRVFFVLPKSQKQSQLCARYYLLSYEQIFDTLISIRNYDRPTIIQFAQILQISVELVSFFATGGEKVFNIEKGGNIEKKELYTKL